MAFDQSSDPGNLTAPARLEQIRALLAAGVGGTVADGANVALGAKADAAASSDTGTFSLISLFKRLLQKLTSGLGIVPVNSTIFTGSAAALNADILADTDATLYRSVSIQLTGTWSATVSPQVSVDGGTSWNNVVGINVQSGAQSVNLTSNGIYAFPLPAGAWFRLRAVAYTSGTVNGSVIFSSVAMTFPTVTMLPGSSITTTIAAGETHIGEVGGNSARITLAFTVSTSPAYSNGDVIGGKITISGALRASGKSAILQDLHLFDAANQKPAGSLLFFNADPAAATTTDNSAFAYSTDTAKQIARVDIAASDWTTIDSKASLHIRNIGALLSAASGVDVYAVFVTTSTPTFAATNNLSGSVSVLRD